MAEYESVMSRGNLATNRLSDVILGEENRDLFRKIISGIDDPRVTQQQTKRIRNCPEKEMILAVREIHDEVYKEFTPLQYHLARRLARRWKLDPESLVGEARLATSKAIFAYVDTNVRFNTFVYQVIRNHLIDIRRVSKAKKNFFISLSQPEKPIDFPAPKSEPELTTFYGYDVETVMEVYEQVKLKPEEREIIEAFQSDIPICRVSEKYNKTRQWSTLTLQAARRKIIDSYHDAMLRKEINHARKS